MATKIDTVSGRERLTPRREPYWHRISKARYVGCRKMSKDSEGTWIARAQDESSDKQLFKTFGEMHEVPPHQRFDAAVKAATAWFEHLERGGTVDTTVTLKTACEEYVDSLRNNGRAESANDAEGRFKRWVYGNAKLCATPLVKLTPKLVSDWRTTLLNTKALPQDKKKTPSKPRSASSLNRDMTPLRAALNLALENGHVTTDAAWRAKLRPVKGADGRREIYLDRSERQRLIAAAPEDLGNFLRALSMVPLRPGAMAALTARQLDRRLCTLIVGKDKAGADRRITLPAATAAFFGGLCTDKLPMAFIFMRADGMPWNKDNWKKPFKAAAASAGLRPDATIYALRHSIITDLIALHKLDTLTVAQLSGTSLAMIEKHYGHLLREHAANALAQLAI